MNRRKIKYNDVPFVPCNDCANWESCQEEAYEQGRLDAYKDADERLRYLWDRYEADKENVPKPQFTDAIALTTLLELDEEEKK